MNRYSNLNFSIICKLRQQNYFPHIKYISKGTFSVSSSSVDEEGSDEASLVLIAVGMKTDTAFLGTKWAVYIEALQMLISSNLLNPKNLR